MATKDFDAPVLISGGGLVGFSAAMFLAQHGIRSLTFEQRRDVLHCRERRSSTCGRLSSFVRAASKTLCGNNRIRNSLPKAQLSP